MDQLKPKNRVIEETEKKIQEPHLYKVVLLNDDYTTRDFVVEVLTMIFHKDVPTATRIMLDVHRKGRGIVGTYTYDIALTKANAVHQKAREENFPLRCVVEEA